jgi:hypothetical protein
MVSMENKNLTKNLTKHFIRFDSLAVHYALCAEACEAGRTDVLTSRVHVLVERVIRGEELSLAEVAYLQDFGMVG